MMGGGREGVLKLRDDPGAAPPVASIQDRLRPPSQNSRSSTLCQRHPMKRFSSLVLSLAVVCGHAWAAGPATERNGVLADSKGMTLYTFKKDAPSISNCYDACAKAWPPFIAKQGASASGDFSLVERKDGGQQWAYKSMPLYYYAGDAAPGDTTGDGSGNVWTVVRSAGGGAGAKAGGYTYTY
jgi:predicted lipoprotein with Yx(FWY)xxD motif